MSDVLDDLERLVRLRDAGALTPQEFEARKAILFAAPAECPHCRAPLQLDTAGRCSFCHMPVAVTGAPPAGGAPVTDADAFDDSIARAHPKQLIGAIKELRARTDPHLDLRAAKDRMEAAFARVYGR